MSQPHTAISTDYTCPDADAWLGTPAESVCADTHDFAMAIEHFNPADSSSHPVTVAEANELDSLIEDLIKTEHFDELLSSSAWPPIEDSMIDDWPELDHVAPPVGPEVVPMVPKIEYEAPPILHSGHGHTERQTREAQVLRAMRNNPLLAQVIRAVRECKRQGLELGSPSSTPRAKRICASAGFGIEEAADDAPLSSYLQQYIACLKRMQQRRVALILIALSEHLLVVFREEQLLKQQDEWYGSCGSDEQE